MTAFVSELRKAHRRFDLPVTIAIALVVLVWGGASSVKSAAELAIAYSGYFYTIPIMNCVVMPIGMAVLASRIWDAETKGGTCKLLFTLQSRTSLYGAKAALGMLENLLVCAIECGGLLVMGQLQHFTQTLDWAQWFWLFGCTFVVNSLLYFFALFLSVCSNGPVPVLAVGMIGALTGLFTAFMPIVMSFFIPWGYYTPLGAMQMLWDDATRTSSYEVQPFRFWLLALSAVLAVAAAFAGWQAIKKKEV